MRGSSLPKSRPLDCYFLGRLCLTSISSPEQADKHFLFYLIPCPLNSLLLPRMNYRARGCYSVTSGTSCRGFSGLEGEEKPMIHGIRELLEIPELGIPLTSHQGVFGATYRMAYLTGSFRPHSSPQGNRR